MNYQRYSYGSGAPPLTPILKLLLIVNVSIWFLFQILLEGFFKVPFARIFAMIPNRVIFDFWLWQPITYMFLHSTNLTHILFNMLMLWFMGGELEVKWGSRYFLKYYLICGIGGAFLYLVGHVVYFALTGFQGLMSIPVVGASGALFGLMLAWGILFGERQILFMMIFPMKARFFVTLLAAIQISSLLTSGLQGTEVAHLAHLGGLFTGLLMLKGPSWWNKYGIKRKIANRGNLKLVVDNEAPSDRPKYWN